MFDIVVSAVILIMSSPLMLVLCLIIVVKMGSPIFFIQERPGKSGKIFKLIKFRTMQQTLDISGKLDPDDKRITSVGGKLRSSSLDELPSFWNVLKGDMSLVGPRPLLVEYLDYYTKEQSRRHDIKPGITGWAQINGRNLLTWEEKFELDVWYVNNRTFLLDLKILIFTIGKVLRRDGISSRTSITMEKYTGKRST